jgi:integrase
MTSPRIINDFKAYLLQAKSRRGSGKLSRNSAHSYFNKFKAALKQAYRDGILPDNINDKIDYIKTAETRREFLTTEELNLLANTPFKNKLLKRAAIFSALTGLRYSDIEKLTWRELVLVADQGYYIKFVQKKTQGVETLPISDEAYLLLGEAGQPTDKVFDGLQYSDYQNQKLREWVGEAGLTKHITFHSFRHTFATLQLSHGTDIMTISKMLGHRELKTTQIYAKVLDKSMRMATDKIKITMNLPKED